MKNLVKLIAESYLAKIDPDFEKSIPFNRLTAAIVHSVRIGTLTSFYEEQVTSQGSLNSSHPLLERLN